MQLFPPGWPSAVSKPDPSTRVQSAALLERAELVLRSRLPGSQRHTLKIHVAGLKANKQKNNTWN